MLKRIRLELARTKDHPDGSPNCGYEFKAPLDGQGRIDLKGWEKDKKLCTVRRFWENADDEHGLLLHLPRDRWVFSYAPGEDDDEPIFKFDRHAFKKGEYVSITEHDGVVRPFKIVAVD